MKKGNTTIIASIFAISLVTMILGMGTMAYFSDTATSNPNIFRAGRMDISLSQSSSHTVVQAKNLQPGEIITGTMTVTNVGTLTGDLYGRTSYVKVNFPPNLANMLLVNWVDIDTIRVWTGPQALSAFATPTVWQPYGSLTSSQSRVFDMEIEFDTTAGNSYQWASIDVTFEFKLTQVGVAP